MDNGIWKMQQEARVRVATQRAREHRVMEEENRRTASLRGGMPPERPMPLPPPPPPPPVAYPPSKELDSEQILLLLLALLLAQAGAGKMLVLAVLYLAL